MILQKGDICEGCVFDSPKWTTSCRLRELGKDKDCPCTNCLVKIVCRASEACKLYSDLIETIQR